MAEQRRDSTGGRTLTGTPQQCNSPVTLNPLAYLTPAAAAHPALQEDAAYVTEPRHRGETAHHISPAATTAARLMGAHVAPPPPTA